MWSGTAMFAGGMSYGLYEFINNENGSYSEFGEAAATNKKGGTDRPQRGVRRRRDDAAGEARLGDALTHLRQAGRRSRQESVLVARCGYRKESRHSMAGRTAWIRTLVLAGGIGLGLIPSAAVAQTSTDDGIPVEQRTGEEQVRRMPQARREQPDVAHLLSARQPGELGRTIERMISINHAAVSAADARTIVKYLADHNGLAPEEARPAAFEYERRIIEYTYQGDTDTAALCQACHSFGRVMSERRTNEEWGLLLAMHRGYFPLVDNQPMQNGQGFRRSRALAPDVDRQEPADGEGDCPSRPRRSR